MAMHPFKERMKLVPESMKQLLKCMKILEKIEKGPEDIDPTLLSLYEAEKEKYIIMSERFKELNEIIEKEGADK